MSKLPRFVRLAFVLFIAAMVVFCALLLFPDYFIIDKRSHMMRKQQISMAKGNQEADESSSELEKLFNKRKQFAKIAAYNAHLLTKGFTDEQV
jgi:F0F1-type ATP synthase membrane subunit b/b'